MVWKNSVAIGTDSLGVGGSGRNGSTAVKTNV